MNFLESELGLKLKSNKQLNRSCKGIPFLGYRVFPGKVQLSPRSKKRFIHKFRNYEKKQQHCEWSIDELVLRMGPLIEFTKHADAFNLRRNIIHNSRVSF